MRDIYFNAWLPDLEIMLENITVYCDAQQIGIDADTLSDLVKAKNKDWSIMDDGVYFSNDENFDRLLTLLCGEDWYWIDFADCVVLEYSGINDESGQKIFEGDIISIRAGILEIVFKRGCFCVKQIGKTEPKEYYLALRFLPDGVKKIGNIYQTSMTK